MNIVLYTRDMEPITVIDLPMWAIALAERYRHVRVAVIDPPICVPAGSDSQPRELVLRSVVLEFHRLFMPGNVESWIVTVDDDVLALKLRPSWLPGQNGRINEYERTVRSLSEMLLRTLSGRTGGAYE